MTTNHHDAELLARYIVTTATGDHRVWIAAALHQRQGVRVVRGDWGDAELCPDCGGWDAWLGCGVSDLIDALHLPAQLADPICEELNGALDEGRLGVRIPLDSASLVVRLDLPEPPT